MSLMVCVSHAVEFNVFKEKRSGRKGASKVTLLKAAPGWLCIHSFCTHRIKPSFFSISQIMKCKAK